MMKQYLSYAVLMLLVATTMACAREASPTTPEAVVAATPKTGVATAPTLVPPQAPKPKVAPKEPTVTPSAAPYYRGKIIEMIIASAPGGGDDTTGRIIASFLPKYLPGNPRIITRNQPGAATVVANNAFAQKAKPDGLTLITSSFSLNSITRPDIARYDLRTFEFLGNVTRGSSILLVRKGALERLTDRGARPVHVGTRDATGSSDAMALWGQEFLGWNIRWVLGFAGTAEIELAFRRGEVDMFATSNELQIRNLINEGLASAIAQIGMFAGGKIVRRSDFSDTPVFEELLGAKKPSGIPWEAYNAWVRPGLVDKYCSAPPGTPATIMNILTGAFTAMSRDSQFDETVRRTLSPIYSVTVGQDTATFVKEILNVSPEALKYGTDLMDRLVMR